MLAGHLAAAMTRGIQEGEDSRYVKLLGALKHFTVYSMEHSDGSDRGGFSPTISKHDMGDSYLPAYRIGIEQQFLELQLRISYPCNGYCSVSCWYGC